MKTYLLLFCLNYVLFRFFPFKKHSDFKLLLIFPILFIVYVLLLGIIGIFITINEDILVHFVFSLIFRHFIIVINAKLFNETKKKDIRYFFPRDISKEIFIIISLIQFYIIFLSTWQKFKDVEICLKLLV